MPDVETVETVVKGTTLSQLVIALSLGMLFCLAAIRWVTSYVRSQIKNIPNLTEELKNFSKEMAGKFDKVIDALNNMRIQLVKMEESKMDKDSAEDAIAYAIEDHERKCPYRNQCRKE